MLNANDKASNKKHLVMRRFLQPVIEGVKGTRKYATYDAQEAQTHFSTTLSHVAMVELLRQRDGSFELPITEELYVELVKKQIGIHLPPGGGTLRVWIMDDADQD